MCVCFVVIIVVVLVVVVVSDAGTETRCVYPQVIGLTVQREPSMSNNCSPSSAPNKSPENKDSTSRWAESEKHGENTV